MATASTKAIEVLSSTDQTENYQRLSRLIMRAGTELLRALFDSFYPPSSLADKLSESATMDMLRKALLKPQRTVVYPASGSFGESRGFDMSLLSQLLKTLCQTKLPPLDSGWDCLPSPSNSTLTADIVRIKVYRNDIFHKHYNGELDYVEFCSLWNESKVALLSIAYQISPETKREWEEAIERLWCDPLTPEAARDAEELQKMYWSDMITKEYLASGFARVEKKIQILSEEVKEGIDGVKSEVEKLGEELRNRASSSAAEGGAVLPIIIAFKSMTSPFSQEEAPTTTISSHVQPTASVDDPWATFSITPDQSMRRIVLEFRRHYDPSTTEENGFVQHLEDVDQAPAVDANVGSLVLTVKCSSLEILERLWQDYSSGHLGKIAQEFLVTERVLEDLGLVELKLKITISEEDYQEGRRHFRSDYSEEDEYIPSQHPKAEDNRFVQHLEDVNQVPIVDVNPGSLVLTVRCSSLEILERLWQDYSSGHLGKVAQEFLVTERVLEDLGLVELKLKITIPENDYWKGRLHFPECAGSDYSEETEGGQKEDGKEDKYIPFQHPTETQQLKTLKTPLVAHPFRWWSLGKFIGGGTFGKMGARPHPSAATRLPFQEGIYRQLSLLPRTVPHFVNRETECEEIREYLSPLHDCRCLLIHGATGIGKTTVATKVANDIRNSDGRTVVIYVNCRNIKLSQDFAEKALQQVYHAPVDNSIPELKNRLKSQHFFTIFLLDNFEFILHLDDRMQLPESELSLQRMNPSEEGSRIKNLINEILMVRDNIKLLLTSSETVCFPEAGQETVHLSPFKPEETVELLKMVWKNRPVNTTQAHDFSEICSGIPLVLYTLASSHSDLPSLLEAMRCSSPAGKLKILTKIQTISEDMKINIFIDHCFERLDLIEKGVLIRFALLRRRFSLSEAVKIFKSEEMSASQLRQCGLELSRRSLLEKQIIGDECSYTLLRVIGDYCETKAMEQEFREVILDAKRMFIRHFLTFLEDIFEMFLDQYVSEAIAAFQKDEANVMQLVEWCRNGKMDEEQTRRCIDVFNSVTELLAKMMGKAKFEYAFISLRKRCEEMKDKTRLSDCLTSLGLKEVFSCSCPPIGPCALHAERAKEYFTKADRIQRNLGVKKGNSRAQCLAKLGRCLATEGFFEEAKEKVQQAIRIRSEGQDDNVMLGATYNDLGVILSLEGNHEQAIKVREEQTLPIYKETLHKHPFTATILNSLSNNHYALGNYEAAEQYSKKALKIRHELLKDHRDTAKSLFDLAMVHKMKEEFELAEDCLEKCEAMQKKILDEGNDALKSTRKELKEVKRRLTGAMQGNS